MGSAFSSIPAEAAARFDVPVEDGVTLAAYALPAPETGTDTVTDAPVLIWGQANGFSAGAYLPFLQRLATRFRVFAYDARGQGGSTTPPPPFDETICFDRFAHDLEAVVYRVQAEAPEAPLYYAGHSFSAAAMFYLGGGFGFAPWRKVTTFDATLRPSDRDVALPRSKDGHSPLAEMTLKRRRYFDNPDAYAAWMGRPKAFGGFEPEMLAALCRGTLQPRRDGAGEEGREEGRDGTPTATAGWELCCPPAVEAATYNAVSATTAPYDSLRDFPVSTHLVAADFNTNGGHWIGEIQADVARHLPDARVTILPGAGHLMPFEQPDACAEIIFQMLED